MEYSTRLDDTADGPNNLYVPNSENFGLRTECILSRLGLDSTCNLELRTNCCLIFFMPGSLDASPIESFNVHIKRLYRITSQRRGLGTVETGDAVDTSKEEGLRRAGGMQNVELSPGAGKDFIRNRQGVTCH